MAKQLIAFGLVMALAGCSQPSSTITDSSTELCDEKPNCVSTMESRDEYQIPEFLVTQDTRFEAIVEIAANLPGAEIADQRENYARIECTSRFFKFVDDLEIRLDGKKLIVRSQSRTGYSDFGVNRERTEQLRRVLFEQGLIQK